MADYTTVENVESALGYVFDDTESAMVNSKIHDFSIWLDAYCSMNGIYLDPEYNPGPPETIVRDLIIEWWQTHDIPALATSVSQQTMETTQTIGFAEGTHDNALPDKLSAYHLALLGVRRSVHSFLMTTNDDDYNSGSYYDSGSYHD